MAKDLKDKAIKIKGKDYVLVSDRVIYFNENYPNGSIQTEYTLDNDTYHFKATVIPDISQPERKFTGHSQATVGDGMVNKTAAMENAETSSVGRCLGLMGIGVLESIASADEMNKATNSKGMRYATEKQIEWLRDTTADVFPDLNGDTEIDARIEQILTVPPQKVPLFKVKDAVDLIKTKREPAKPLDASGITLTDEDIKKIDNGTLLDELPY